VYAVHVAKRRVAHIQCYSGPPYEYDNDGPVVSIQIAYTAIFNVAGRSPVTNISP